MRPRLARRDTACGPVVFRVEREAIQLERTEADAYGIPFAAVRIVHTGSNHPRERI
jgi:hypothetical protein